MMNKQMTQHTTIADVAKAAGVSEEDFDKVYQEKRNRDGKSRIKG